ncbi:hypothetical protein ACFFX0_31075 [Citricoccus parietis]|uniref:Uncharacterized protein n=1 Tax=Citricoccus parietis TaxID=592307 RepID=A0ABV5G8U4_9MICC
MDRTAGRPRGSSRGRRQRRSHWFRRVDARQGRGADHRRRVRCPSAGLEFPQRWGRG